MTSTFVGLLILTVAVFEAHSAATNPFLTKAKSSKEKCIAEHDVDIEVFKKLWREHKLPETDKGKCFMACFMKGIGVYADGKFDREVLNAIAELKYSGDDESIEKAKKVQSICVDEVKTEDKEECGLAYEAISCFIREADKVGLMPPGHKETDEE